VTKLTISNSDNSDPADADPRFSTLKINWIIPNSIRVCRLTPPDRGLLPTQGIWTFNIPPVCGGANVRTVQVNLDGVIHHFKCDRKECWVLDP
jgi:hypothetical protein